MVLLHKLFISENSLIYCTFILYFSQHHGQIDPKMYFWDTEIDSLSYFNFESGRGEQDDFPPEQIEGVEGDTNDAER